MITKAKIKLSPIQATIISFLVVVLFMAVSLVLFIGYRDTGIILYIFAGVIALLVGVAIFNWPHLGAYLLIITLFSNMSSVFTDQGLPSLNKPLVVFVLLSVIVNRIVKKRPFPPLRQVELLFLAYGFVWLLSSFAATDQIRALDHIVDFVKDFILIFTIIVALETHKHWQQALWLLLIVAMVLAAMSSYQVLSGNFEQEFFGFAIVLQEQVLQEVYESRLTGPIGDPNFYGMILVSIVPLAIYYFLDEKRVVLRGIAGLTMLLLLFAIINTYSRGAFLALGVTIVFIAIERRVSPSFLIGGGLVLLLMLPFLPGSFGERMSSLLALGAPSETAVKEESSFRGRTSEALSGLLMFVDRPLLGVGINNYPNNYQKYSSQLGLDSRTTERDPHSLYIEALAETGIIGFSVFSLFLTTLMVSIHRARKKLQQMNLHPKTQRGLIALQMSLIAFLIASIFLHGAFIRYLWLLVALGAAGIHIAHATPEPNVDPLSP